MSMTRGALLTLVDEMADAAGSPRWGTTLKRQLLGEVHWREWRDLLNVNRMLRVGDRTVTTDANGRVAKSALNAGSGDTLTTSYRILTVRADNIFYTPARYEEYPISPAVVSLPQVWYELGDELQLIPAAPGTVATITVNHIPARADTLSDDNATVTFPDGYDLLLAYETAASMFMKGAAESNLTAEMRSMATALRERLHQDVSRLSTRPTRVMAMDDKMDWGSA